MRIALCLLLVCLAAPATGAAQGTTAVRTAIPAVDPAAPRSNAAISPLDRLEVTVFREPELSVADVPVDESGRILLPLVGEFSASGKSPQMLATDIEGKLRQYVRSPQVAVRIKQAASKKITVAGSVMEPGVFPIEGRVTLLQAIALARGPSQVAALDQTLIFRTVGGRKTAARFDLRAIERGRAEDPEVLPGDTVAIGNSKGKTAWRDILASLRSFNIFGLIP